MKKAILPALTLALLLLSACGRPTAAPPSEPLDPSPTPTSLSPDGPPSTPASVPGDWVLTRCRIVDGADTGKLILAGEGANDVYTLNISDLVVTLDGGSSSATELRDGMWIDVGHTGMILETFPAQFEDPKTVGGSTEGLDDRCGLYLQVLDDLWEADPGLNGDITDLGVDLSALTDLTESEKAAVAYAFGMAHGPIFPLTGTFDELADQGYIDKENLYWEDGILFTVTGSAETGFAAQKWRSGDGALFLNGCTAAQDGDGAWTYETGSVAIS